MIVLCVNELAGTTGYHKSVVETANALHRGGYPLVVLSMLGAADGAANAMPKWALETDIPVVMAQTMVASQGSLLSANVFGELKGRVYSTAYSFTRNQLAALRQLDSALTRDDTIIFTTAIHALAFHHALLGTQRNAKTVLQVHGDYRHHDQLWTLVDEARDTIDTVQTVATGLMDQFRSRFPDSHIVCIPNIHYPVDIHRTPKEGVEIALPASFQHRKNQLDAIKALSMIEDSSVRLALWGNISPLNPYFIAVQESIKDLGLQDRVSIPGFGTEKDIYSSADIVLMTSLSEGFGYPLLEAAFHSLPAVTYDYEFGPRDVINDGESGFIVPIGDVSALAERLHTLASDAALRRRFGEQARKCFDERFSAQAVVEQYATILGPPAGNRIDLVALLSPTGDEPIGMDQISHDIVRKGTGRQHRLTVHSPSELHDIRVENEDGPIEVHVVRQPSCTVISFALKPRLVVSYALSNGSAERYYLAGPSHGSELPIQPYLRRDADYGDGTLPVTDSLIAARGGAGHVSLRETSTALFTVTRDALEWKIRQLAPMVIPTAKSPRNTHPGQDQPGPSTANETIGTESQNAPIDAAKSPATEATSDRTVPGRIEGIGRVIGLPTQALNSVAQIATRYGKTGVKALSNSVLVKPASAPTRELPRHPRHPVTAGRDNFGAAINAPDAVCVQNSGDSSRPTVSLRGEYDWVEIHDAGSMRRISPPWTYGEMFERICEAEQAHGLFDIATDDGVYLWELGRSALVIQLAEAAGLWGPSQSAGGTVQDIYTGAKRLSQAPTARNVVFDYVRRGQSGYRTAPFVNDDTLFVVQPEADGYPAVNETNMVYPFFEFNEWKKKPRQRWAHLRVPEVDTRPFENALTDALGIKVDLGDHLRNRLAKFLAEREFWTPVFERVQPEEVLIASSHWWAGIAAAAKRSGAQVSDIQYALTSHYAPSFWFGSKPHYGASRFYSWSEYWAARTNVYHEHVVVPREQPELQQAMSKRASSESKKWDVCVIAQPRVLRRILTFAREIVNERPELRVVIAPHPAQRNTIEHDIAAAGIADRVTIAQEDTLSTIADSELAVGTFSTSLWESAALGCPTYVIKVPGYEETLRDIETGLFTLAQSPHDLIPYPVPQSRTDIFGF